MMLCAHPYHCNVLHYIQIVPPPEPEGQLCDLFTFESLLTSCRLNCTELLSARGWGGGGGFRGAGGVGGTALSWPCFRVYRGKVERTSTPHSHRSCPLAGETPQTGHQDAQQPSRKALVGRATPLCARDASVTRAINPPELANRFRKREPIVI